jgi:hypothetical protein
MNPGQGAANLNTQSYLSLKLLISCKYFPNMGFKKNLGFADKPIV